MNLTTKVDRRKSTSEGMLTKESNHYSKIHAPLAVYDADLESVVFYEALFEV